jgi:energy-coupling factor transporter ATP-binding protein EcfA2
MSTHHIVRESKIENSFRVQQIRGIFDYSSEIIRHEWNSTLDFDAKPWSIGLIVGSSGSGKTTLAKEIFKDFYVHDSFEWDSKKAIVDGFDEHNSIKEITSTLNAVGFSSPPHWLKPFHHLSNGQKFRAELARCLLLKTNGIVFDEFTSVVDRDVAKIGCAAISKALRRKGSPPFVAVSCHYDIIEWLDPDWVFDVGTQRFEWRERRRFPEIKLDVYQTTSDTWAMFREYHYLDHSFNKAARSFVACWNSKPVAFCAALHFPHPSCSKLKREHRTVVIPDFQGVGIGNRLSEFIASYFCEKGFRFISTTSSPSMIYHRNNSPKWKIHRFGRVSQPKTGMQCFDKTISTKRITAGFEFIHK